MSLATCLDSRLFVSSFVFDLGYWGGKTVIFNCWFGLAVRGFVSLVLVESHIGTPAVSAPSHQEKGS